MKSLMLSANTQNKIAFHVFFWTSKVYHFVVSWLLVLFVLLFSIPSRNTDTHTHREYQTNPELNQQTNKRNFHQKCVLWKSCYFIRLCSGNDEGNEENKGLSNIQQTL